MSRVAGGDRRDIVGARDGGERVREEQRKREDSWRVKGKEEDQRGGKRRRRRETEAWGGGGKAEKKKESCAWKGNPMNEEIQRK